MRDETIIQFVSLALDAALMKQTAIANNIANANTPNYQTLEVNFEQQLSAHHSIQDEKDWLASIQPFYQMSDTYSSIDQQMALSIKNSTHYRALVKGLNHKLAIMKLALQGNNPS